MVTGTIALIPVKIKDSIGIHYDDLTDTTFFCKIAREGKPR
ncbi:MAG: hypothetical protein QXP36_09785 [Conexivisphaerales archaeon]